MCKQNDDEEEESVGVMIDINPTGKTLPQTAKTEDGIPENFALK